MKRTPKPSLIERMAGHRISGTLLMVIVLIAGVLAFMQINVQFFPVFEIKYVVVSDVWPGASAREVKKSITDPIEKELKGLDNVLRIESTSTSSSSSVVLELSQDANLTEMIEKIKDRVVVIPLPENAEDIKVRRITQFEPVTRVVLTGPSNDPASLTALALKIEKDLISKGIERVQLTGLPNEEISIVYQNDRLRALNLTHLELANIIAGQSVDSPAGVIGLNDTTFQVKGDGLRSNVQAFEQLPLPFAGNSLLQLGDVATVSLEAKANQPRVFVKGKAAVDIFVSRLAESDSLESANILDKYLAQVKPTLPPGYQLEKYYEFSKIIKDRLFLLLDNGISGAILIFLVLLLFLNVRVATWVSVGVPISFAAAFVVLYMLGASINIIASLGFLLSIGIIVDDTIVVGEESLRQFEQGKKPLEAAVIGAKKMVLPVFASSFTTVAAFLPLLIVGGYIGDILIAIPLVVIAVILASLLECFLILPYHLRRSFNAIKNKKEYKVRQGINRVVQYVQYVWFRKVVRLAIAYRWVTISIALMSIVLTISLVISGRPAFNFFPSPPGRDIYVDVTFNPGASEQQKTSFLTTLDNTLQETDDAYEKQGQRILDRGLVFYNQQSPLASGGIANAVSGDNYASMIVRIISPEERTVTNADFINAWSVRIPDSPWVESVVINEPQAGPPGSDFQIVLLGDKMENLKKAALAIGLALSKYDGVSDIADNMPYGYQQIVFSLTPKAYALGLSQAEISRQLRTAVTGIKVHSLYKNNREIEVNVRLPDSEKDYADILQKVDIKTNAGQVIPLNQLVTFDYARDFNVFRTLRGDNAITVTAAVDSSINNTNRILASLGSTLKDIERQYGVTVSLAEQSRDQKQLLDDMQMGTILGLCLIYIILAWVSASYYWPIFVMLSIPLGLVGAVWGHIIMGQELTTLSLFGLFGLAGVVVNSSIILLLRFKEIRDSGVPMEEAIVEAACQRLRPVFLTTITTIGGLLPLLFETAFQAQFLVPIATSLCFGLLFSTLLILLLIPTLITMYEGFIARIKKSSSVAKRQKA